MALAARLKPRPFKATAFFRILFSPCGNFIYYMLHSLGG